MNQLKRAALPLVAATIAGLLTACQPGTKQLDAEQNPDVTTTPSHSITYPTTRKGEVVDTYFGVEVADPYRWLEDDRSEETANWVKAQNQVTQNYLANIPYRQDIADKLSDLLNYERVSAPFKEGDYTYFYKNDGLQNQSVVYRQKGDEAPEVFIDPNTFSEDGTVSLAGMEFSEDGSLVAYQTSTGGSDWRDVFIMNAETKEQIDDKLVNVKFSNISWYKNEGFYYSSYDKPKGSELSEKTDQHKVYYHKIGTDQAEDAKVFGHNEAQKHRYVGAQVGDENRYLVVGAAESTSGNRLFVKDLQKPNSEFITIKNDLETDASLLLVHDGKFYFKTNLNAPNSKVVTVETSNPSVDHWTDVLPETEHVLSVSTVGGYFFAEYMVDAISQVKQHALDGTFVRDVSLPGIGAVRSSGRGLGDVASFKGPKDASETYFMFENYSTPNTTYLYDLESGKSELVREATTSFDGSQYVSEQVFYTSKDGTKVPMIITHHKDMQLNGENPTLLYGYGGFNISLTPRYSAVVAAWLEMGGVYAVPNIRGGGEYGKAWHKAGTQLQKQNVFDDFIAAGEYLIEKRYTSKQYLALRGGSNGGLLVGAVMTQRPDLAQVALPAVGVLDMLRYHTFTAGAGWAYDYGTSEQSEEMFRYLLNYSPIHNVESGVDYPATMITTADHDDRVVPAHSFKFAAELQEKNTGPNPMLIRIETDAGHGAGTPVSKTIEEYADIFGFTLYSMGVEKL
ncbi:prolyl oligopeptidase family serine peptidase [Alteromonas ponticola]|uniref:prolyl oligopeptidase n=1 Tax=Alteromonas aquimaris TaxID=2998417 RepID=A0ABT3PA99_9ALTE|nr:prolyl oligopeptidase family serine peptidase [Alteromonas aquimaris]MCW8109697.1 prolyl oligopeptidase family serine peptidase [Alteromonas aquimaris]